MGRLAGLFRAAGLRPAVLKSDTVAPEKREEWVEQRVKEGIHCLIVHPRCVQTGLDLLAFATICYAEVEYSTYVLRQASRRSWRIGQKWPVRVYFLVRWNRLSGASLQQPAGSRARDEVVGRPPCLKRRRAWPSA